MRLARYLAAILVLVFCGNWAWKVLSYHFFSGYSGAYAGKQQSVDTRRAWIAYSNFAVSYPFSGAIVPGVAQSKVGAARGLFIDLRNGTRHELSLGQIRYNAIEAIPNSPGAFLLTGHRDGKRLLVRYDAVGGTFDIVFETDKEIRNPFLFGEVACAFYPTGRTNLQSVGLKPICDGISVPDTTIDTISATAFTERQAAFLDRMYPDANLYILEREADSWLRIDVPLLIVSGFFAYEDRIYVAGRTGGEKFELYRLDKKRLEPVVGDLLERVRAIDARTAASHYIGQDHIVTADLDSGMSSIEIKVFDTGASEPRLHRLSLND